MTNEEKAEEYYEKNRIINCMPYDDKESYIKAYLDGLAEGRKESCEVCEKSSMKEYQKLFDKEYKIIEELEQKNAELKKENEEIINALEKTMPLKLANQLKNENVELNRDKTELVNSVTELKDKVTELEKQLKNNPYIIQLQNEKAEMAENFAKQIENLKMVTSSWIMSLEDVKESKVNDRRNEVLRELERRMKELEK